MSEQSKIGSAIAKILTEGGKVDDLIVVQNGKPDARTVGFFVSDFGTHRIVRDPECPPNSVYLIHEGDQA